MRLIDFKLGRSYCSILLLPIIGTFAVIFSFKPGLASESKDNAENKTCISIVAPETVNPATEIQNFFKTSKYRVRNVIRLGQYDFHFRRGNILRQELFSAELKGYLFYGRVLIIKTNDQLAVFQPDQVAYGISSDRSTPATILRAWQVLDAPDRLNEWTDPNYGRVDNLYHGEFPLTFRFDSLQRE